MSGFRCLALETGVRPSTVAACNGDRHFETSVPGGAKIAAALYETIDRVLDEVDLSLDDLDCIAFGRGPGAFTGLRVAAAAAQGLATGLGIRVCAVSSLAALAQDAWDRAPGRTWIAPALPAGRDQVYLGWYRIAESGLVSAETDDRLAPTAQSRLPGTARFVAAGKIWSEDEALQAANAGRIAAVADSAAPPARAVLRLAKQEYGEGRLLRPEDARPVYLRGALGDPAYKA
ncbi:MAG: tRNA (adenosine(37)-N6)-threonylcarbamoyltransferase complex dimerization subunit type 1 TsaB [Gammaproteobacteria bacterium]|nr:tRNA (adenosine(37)-N6)-threonylcarbamoyltransferase complex dimerization subunit type 1 TsaB [Gammaproteobacteria bacterium]